MYYRYEAKNKNGEFVGIFQVFNSFQGRYFNRFLRAPKWYDTHPDVDSKCWFTEEGYQKYRHVIDQMIKETYKIEARLLTAEKLDNLVVNGKIQCIQLV